jgi:hypothetical protein
MDFKTIKKKSLLDSEPNQNNFKFLGVLFKLPTQNPYRLGLCKKLSEEYLRLRPL